MKNLLKRILSAALALALAVPMAVTVLAATDSTEAEEVTAKFYSDAEMTVEIAAIAGGIFVNGGKILQEDSDEKIDYKNTVIYSDMESAVVDPDGDSGKKPAKVGKLTIAVTTSSETPELVKGKIVKDTAAAEILKATYKKTDKSIKLTANKKAGKVYVHLIDINCKKEIQQAISIPVVVGEAAAKVVIYQDEAVVKKGTVNVYDMLTLTYAGQNKDGEAIDSKCTVTVDAKSEDYVSARIVSNKLYITAEDLDYDKPGKPLKAKVTVTDTKSGKKAAFSLSVVDRVAKAVAEGSSSDTLKAAKSTVELDYWIETVGENDVTTDKVKFYICESGTEPKIGEKNKVLHTKYTGVTAKLNKDGDTLTLTSKVAKPNCDIYAAYTDSTTKQTDFFLIAYVVDGAVVCTAE